jgi:hypothetical protein
MAGVGVFIADIAQAGDKVFFGFGHYHKYKNKKSCRCFIFPAAL